MKAKQISQVVLIAILLLATASIFYHQFNKEKEVIAAKVGHNSPNFKLKDIEGVEHSLSEFQGKGVVVNFWATYCPPCEKEMPILEAGYQKYKNQGVDFVGINTGEPTRLVNQFVSKHNTSFLNLLDRGGIVVKKYQIQNLPTTVFINSKGELMDIIYGELSEEKLEAGIDLIKQ